MSARVLSGCSVILPAFNAERTIVAALNSVRTQTRPADEIIVVDDGSWDATAQVAADWGATVISQQNGGPSKARNAGAKISSNEILFFLDADDEWMPDKIENHFSIYENSEFLPAFVFDLTQRVRSGNRLTGVSGRGPAGPVHWLDLFDAKNWTCGSSPSMPKAYWEAIGGFSEELRLAEDIEMLMCLAAEFGPGTRVTEICTRYMLMDDSLSRRQTVYGGVVAAFEKRLPPFTQEMRRQLLTTLVLGGALYSKPGTYLQSVSELGSRVLLEPRFYRYLALRLLNALKIRSI